MKAVLYQPVTELPQGVAVCFSTVADGSTAAGGGDVPTDEQRRRARTFLERHGFVLPSVPLFVTYGDDHTYTDVQRVTVADRGESIPVDALYTTEPGVTLTLPVGDCVATVVYDPVVSLLGVLHLGRHASLAGLIESFAAEVGSAVRSDPNNWHVWMSPSLQVASNKLDYFDPPSADEWRAFVSRDDRGVLHVDIPAHNRERFELLGVKSSRIYASPIDTYTDTRYFSHRAATELGDLSRQGRMMVAAAMTGQREAVS